MSENTGKLIPEGMDPKRYRELLKIMNNGESIGNEEIKQIEDHWKKYAGKKSWGKQPQLENQVEDIVPNTESGVSVTEQQPKKEPTRPKTDKTLIPEGMSTERYEELIKDFSNPKNMGSKEIEEIENNWKKQTNEKKWGNPEELQDELTSTQDISRENVKNSKKTSNNKNKKEYTQTKERKRENQQETKTKQKQKTTSTKDVSNEAIKNSKTEGVVNKSKPKIDIPDGSPTKMQASIIKNAPKIMKGAALFIGTTSLLSTAMSMADKSEEKEQTRKIEKDVKKKAKEEEKKRKDYNVQNAYGRIDTSEIVMEMFNQRIGHHKMGNSRF